MEIPLLCTSDKSDHNRESINLHILGGVAFYNMGDLWEIGIGHKSKMPSQQQPCGLKLTTK